MVETRYVEIPAPAGRLDLTRPHFVGVCGAGMSALAHLLAGRGAQVSGSDVKTGETASRLETAGCRVRAGHDAANIAGASVVVWSSVIDAANPEVLGARAAGVPVVHRSHLLAQLVAGVDRSVVVTGTHGKSTATAMLAAAVGHLSPSWAAGAAPVGGVNGHAGAGLLIAEGDESDRSVALYRPEVAVVLNADDDHPETFAGTADVVGTLTDFATQAGTLVVSADDAGAREVTGRVRGQGGTKVVTFGESTEADVQLLSAVPTAAGGSTVTVLDPRGVQVSWTVPSPGRAAVLASLAAYAAGRVLGEAPQVLASGLSGFAGVQRRMQLLGAVEGVRVVDSFAHHPTAITADIAAARELTDGRVLVAFEPCGATRVRVLGLRMGAALAGADEVVLLPVRDAVATEAGAVTGEGIEHAAASAGVRVHAADGLVRAAVVLAGLARPGDVVVTMGVGEVAGLGALLLQPEARPLAV
ncbi:UDP-N-acetylmuramate--L-alanine ligase [Streptomyces rubrogriseus]|uniref:UDP-N-acetylmuramate--L-alanine ligase n=1 Tax=Streptomyces rubrogriseus TaxID=194673 RepID=A0A6G3TAR6_9ACTN|nr:UDP-N-acetylmuramate--L-alanine ligase [Streptomyces rubrogriseus]